MTMTHEQDFSELCRLCGKNNGIRISILSTECLAKIEAVVPDIVILQYDSLPKYVCHRCVAKVKEFYEFRATCIKTQEEFKKRLPWMSICKKVDTNSALSRPRSPVVMFMGGPLAHPFGDPEPEPEVEVLTLSDDEDSEGVSSSAHSIYERASDRFVYNSMVESVQTSRSDLVRSNVPSHSSIQPSRSSQAAAQMASSSTSSSSIVHSPAALQRCFQPTGSAASSSVYLPPVSKKACLQPPSNNSTQTLERRLQVAPPRNLVSSTSNPTSIKNVQDPASNVGLSTVHTYNGNNNNVVHQSVHAVVPSGSSTVHAETVNMSLTPSQRNVAHRSFDHTESSGNCAAQTKDGTASGLSARSVISDDSYVETVRKLFCSPTVTIGKRPSQGGDKASHELSTKSQSPHEPSVQQAVAKLKPKEKPKPRCKKRHQEITEADLPRIRECYSTVEPVRIFGNKIVVTCKLCFTCLISEDAIFLHKCAGANNNHTNNNKVKITEVSLPKQIVDSNCSESSSLELIISDDENSDCSQTPKHKCNTCGKLFHNLGRLQKHEASHL